MCQARFVKLVCCFLSQVRKGCVVCQARCVKQFRTKPGGEGRFVVCQAGVLCVKPGV